MMRASVLLVVLVMALILNTNARAADEPAAPREKIRIACIGDSVTFGDGLRQREQAYPGQLQKLLGDGYDVRNFGVNSMAILKKADFSYFKNPAYKAALAFNPNIVVMQFGGNDSKTQNWVHKADFLADARELIESFRALPTKPRIVINTTSPAFVNKWNIADEVILNEVIPQLRQTAFNEGLEIIDIHTALVGKGDQFPDKMHPGPEACAYIAKVVERGLMFKDDPAFNIEKSLADKKLAVKVSNFHGFRQLDFTLAGGQKCTVVRPYRVAAGRPFASHTSQWGQEPQTEIGLLQRGFHAVHVVTPERWGSPAQMKSWDRFHAQLKEAGLTGKSVMIGFNQGALACYNWAALHPESVAAIYGDSPVCDFTIVPGGKGKMAGTADDWADLKAEYGFKDDREAVASTLNPVKNLEPLAKAGVAIVHVNGEVDPLAFESGDEVEKQYKALGKAIRVVRRPASDRRSNSLANPEAIVDFILEHVK